MEHLTKERDVKKTVMVLVLAGLLMAPAGSTAAVSYKGKASGSSITFKRSGNQISGIRTVLPTVCVETTGSGLSRAGGELFRPPGRFTLGRTRKVKSLQPAAMNSGTKATKNFTVAAKRSGRRVTGKLRVSFSFLRLDLFRRLPYTYICSGSAKFSASPR
jgi:hypothetical protein